MKKYFAEFVGTFALVFAGTGSIVINNLTGQLSHLGVSFVFGLIVLTMIYALGDVSGAHLNPAVTLGFWASHRLERCLVLPYLLSQFAGAVFASAVLHLLFPGDLKLGATQPSGSVVQSFLLEAIMTWLLMFVILTVSTGAKEKGIIAGVAVGSVICFHEPSSIIRASRDQRPFRVPLDLPYCSISRRVNRRTDLPMHT